MENNSINNLMIESIDRIHSDFDEMIEEQSIIDSLSKNHLGNSKKEWIMKNISILIDYAKKKDIKISL